MSTHGTFHWNELLTDDVEAAKVFYGETIGWSYDEFAIKHGTYWVAMQNGKPVGGIMDMCGTTPDGVSPHWFAYLAVDDVEARIAQVAAAGGQILREPFDIPGIGRVAIVQDKTGAPLGWITPAAQD